MIGNLVSTNIFQHVGNFQAYTFREGVKNGYLTVRLITIANDGDDGNGDNDGNDDDDDYDDDGIVQ